MSARSLAAAALLLALGGCSYFEGRTEPYRPPPAAASPHPDTGRELYQRDCAWCHGNAGQGTRFAPDLVSGTNGPAFVDFVLSTGRMPLNEPHDRMVRSEPFYTDEQIDQIVSFSRTLDAAGPEVPVVDLADADLQRGGVLYQENCAACHSTTGIGGALTRGRIGELTGKVAAKSSILAPPVTDASATEVAEAIRVGPGTMPVFASSTFDDDDVDAIVKYVLYLGTPEDRGGAPIGRVGPVAEGAIGWLVGLGVLLIFTRWIGTKRGEP